MIWFLTRALFNCIWNCTRLIYWKSFLLSNHPPHREVTVCSNTLYSSSKCLQSLWERKHLKGYFDKAHDTQHMSPHDQMIVVLQIYLIKPYHRTSSWYNCLVIIVKYDEVNTILILTLNFNFNTGISIILSPLEDEKKLNKCIC